MASWQELTDYIRSNYKIADDSGGVIKMIFREDNDRTQLALIGRGVNEQSGEEWAIISSAIGRVDDVNLLAAARQVNTYLCGGICVIGDLVCVHHAVPLVNLDINEFVRPLSVVTHAADEIERRLVGTDEF